MPTVRNGGGHCGWYTRFFLLFFVVAIFLPEGHLVPSYLLLDALPIVVLTTTDGTSEIQEENQQNAG